MGGGSTGGIAYGQWDGNDLKMHRSLASDESGTEKTNDLFPNLSSTSVASCERVASRLYAASSHTDGRLRCVWRSNGGGLTWTKCHGTGPVTEELFPVQTLAGGGARGQGWNNCIAVMPNKSDVVVIGWVRLYVSKDKGSHWQRIVRIQTDEHLHADVHAVKFGSSEGRDVLYVGSDGGLVEVDMDKVLGGIDPPPMRSDFNRNLATLQCYSTSSIERQLWGSMSASRVEPRIISTGTHDNGNLCCETGPGETPWHRIVSGDGGWTGIVADGGILHHISDLSDGNNWLVQAHKAKGRTYVGIPQVRDPIGNSKGLNAPTADVVRRPSFKTDAGERMYAVAAVNDPSSVNVPGIYGLFAGGTPYEYHWDQIGRLPHNLKVYSVASPTGAFVYIGVSGGRIFALDTAQGTAIEMGKPAWPRPYVNADISAVWITRIATARPATAFAIATVKYSPSAGSGTNEYASLVIKQESLKWVLTPWMPSVGSRPSDNLLYSLEIVEQPRGAHVVFVSTDSQVYASTDDGQIWHVVSDGLPKRAHCGDLRWGPGREPGEEWLYLSTFGRSVWRASVGNLDHG